jgi:GMP synthase (glutamine-hydrolysing)
MKSAIALRHIAFEDLGSFEPLLGELGYSVRYVDAVTEDISAAMDADLLIVLGGPIGVYETEEYPFLTRELEVIRQRLDKRRPTLGLCLGSQLMAEALGGKVHPGHGKEIGWKTVQLSPEGMASPLRHLHEVPVLHWHGDTFTLPPEATLLASSDAYPHQAFAVGDYALALQFHPEVTALGLERWFVGHACEIASTAGIAVPQLRADTALHAAKIRDAAEAMLREWLGPDR